LNLKDAVQTFERTLIHATLVACDWNQRKASLTLGVLPTTLSEKIRRFDLRPGRGLVPAIGIAAGLNSWCPSCGQEAR
jgi:DNA-binding NtrC family response regulator